MTQEEKAKAYDDALERAKECHIDGLSLHQPVKDVIEHIFPVLKESEDERIRKELVNFIKKNSATPFELYNRFTPEQYIAYLEKQKEQKPVKLNDDTEVGLDRALQIVKGAKGNLCGYQSDDGIYECDHAIQTLERILKNRIEQHAAEWSDEDEHCLHQLILFCENCMQQDGEAIRCATWLKSFRPDSYKNCNSRWKPSEEQMRAVFDASERNDKLGSVLWNLYNDLKKL